MVLNDGSRAVSAPSRGLALWLVLLGSLVSVGCAASPADDRLRGVSAQRDGGRAGSDDDAAGDDDFASDEDGRGGPARADASVTTTRPKADAGSELDAGRADAGTPDAPGSGRDAGSVAAAPTPAAPATTPPAGPVASTPRPVTPDASSMQPSRGATDDDPRQDDAGISDAPRSSPSTSTSGAAMCETGRDCAPRSCRERAALPCCTQRRTCGCFNFLTGCR